MIWRETGAQDFGAKVAQGVQGGTVAQYPELKPSAQ